MTADRETAHTTYVTAEKECNELKKLRDELRYGAGAGSRKRS